LASISTLDRLAQVKTKAYLFIRGSELDRRGSFFWARRRDRGVGAMATRIGVHSGATDLRYQKVAAGV